MKERINIFPTIAALALLVLSGFSVMAQTAENGSMPPAEVDRIIHAFTAKEADVIIPFKCDVHGWMNAYVGVLDHPYFAVTGPDGTFDLKTLPPGTYTIEAWHEKLGPMTQSVTVGPKESKEVNFAFKAPAGASATD